MRPPWWASARRDTPSGGGGEHHAVAGLAGADGQSDGQVGFAGAGAQEDHVLASGDEIQRAQMGDGVAFETAGVVEVELFQGFSCREASRADTSVTAVRFTGRDLPLQAGGQIFCRFSADRSRAVSR
jgi:hypothetical protein